CDRALILESAERTFRLERNRVPLDGPAFDLRGVLRAVDGPGELLPILLQHKCVGSFGAVWRLKLRFPVPCYVSGEIQARHEEERSNSRQVVLHDTIILSQSGPQFIKGPRRCRDVFGLPESQRLSDCTLGLPRLR